MMQKRLHPDIRCGEETPAQAYRNIEKNIGHIPVFFRQLAQTSPVMHDTIMELDSYIWSDGELSRTEKKLIAISIAAAMRDEHAVHAQIQGAKKLGITLAEIDEALRVAFLLAGMPAYVTGKTAAEEIYS